MIDSVVLGPKYILNSFNALHVPYSSKFLRHNIFVNFVISLKISKISSPKLGRSIYKRKSLWCKTGIPNEASSLGLLAVLETLWWSDNGNCRWSDMNHEKFSTKISNHASFMSFTKLLNHENMELHVYGSCLMLLCRNHRWSSFINHKLY